MLKTLYLTIKFQNMKVKKIIGIVFLIAGLIGFLYFTSQKSEKKIFENGISNPGKTVLNIDLKKDQAYVIGFWRVDEKIPEELKNTSFEALLSIKNNLEQVLFTQKLANTSEVKISEEKSSHHGLKYLHSPKNDETIEIEVEIDKGDYIIVKVHKSPNSKSDVLSWIFIILTLTGLIVFIRNRKNDK